MPTVVVPCWARSSGTSATHSAPATTTSSSAATTSYQYQPPSVNGLRLSSNVNSPDGPSLTAESTRCERPFAIER